MSSSNHYTSGLLRLLGKLSEPVRLEIWASWDRWDEVIPKLAKLAGDKLAMVEVYAAKFARSDSWRPQKAAMSFAIMFGKAEDIASRELN